MSATVKNIIGYRFIQLDDAEIPALREKMYEVTRGMGLKGTVILSHEGINVYVAASDTVIADFIAYLNTFTEFKDIWFKVSYSDEQPYKKMLIKHKKTLIPMDDGHVEPEKHTAPYVKPEKLKQWYDEGKDMVIIDTRNDYEVRVGTFENAMDLHLKDFREFPKAVDNLPSDLKDKTVVTFCTGGIRCEKAAALMEEKGFKDVYQLEGGIINYFEKCQGDHWEGDCFVFDQRIAIDPNLQETKAIQCFSCRDPLTLEEQAECGDTCPHCGLSIYGKRAAG